MDVAEFTKNRPLDPEPSEYRVWESARLRLDALLPGKLYIGGFLDDIAEQAIAAKIGLVISTSFRTPAPLQDAVMLRYPFNDDWHNPPVASQVKALARFAADWNKTTKQPVMVHCAYGLNRSALLCGYIMREMTGMNGEEILRHIQQVRPGTLNNQTFALMVAGLQAVDKIED